MEKKTLYVLIDKSLEPVYGCVQGGHAVAEWLLEHRNQDWCNSYLIYLYVDIAKMKEKLIRYEIDFTEFNEPDLDGKTTSIAVLGHKKLFRNLKLVS